MNKPKRIYRYIFFVAIIIIAAGIVAGIQFYLHVFASNVDLGKKESVHLHIPSGSSYEDVLDILIETGTLINPDRFHRVALRKNYPNRIMPGRYLIRNGMSNNCLVNLLRSGKQDPVHLTFTNIRTKEQLAGVISARLETDSLSILQLLNNHKAMAGAGMDTLTGILLFIPNTYQVYWNTTAHDLLRRMQREYEAFWNDARQQRAAEIGLSPRETGILASIVAAETSIPDEMPRIAGVYMNRLQRNIPLQADPTVIFAMGDFQIRRVLNHHLEIDSPYNTYLYAGLPPGPINLPEPRVLDAVLHYEEHDYLYFSAKPDFSGRHVFAKTYAEHLANARRYREALNRMNIYR